MPQQHQDPHGSSSAPQRDLSHHDPERKSPGYKARNNKGHHPPKGINTARNESQSKTHHKNTQHNQTRDNKSQPKNPHKKNPRHNTQPDTSHLVKARQAARPKVSYPEDLPV
ncbi:MAG: hypothetical protein Q4P66_08030, partial [Actinomycetaceae bacterium]|nr:hypothetical protein [Actinomycetaceae bacterium]